MKVYMIRHSCSKQYLTDYGIGEDRKFTRWSFDAKDGEVFPEKSDAESALNELSDYENDLEIVRVRLKTKVLAEMARMRGFDI